MTHLKTLKDIDTIGTDTLKWINSNKLRQEAIKWVKEFELERNTNLDEYYKGAFEQFIYFFNIKESDLA